LAVAWRCPVWCWGVCGVECTPWVEGPEGPPRGVETHNRRHDREVSLIDSSLSAIGHRQWVREEGQTAAVPCIRSPAQTDARESVCDAIGPGWGEAADRESGRVGRRRVLRLRRVLCPRQGKKEVRFVLVAGQTTAAFPDGRLRASAVSSKMRGRYAVVCALQGCLESLW
jgi:hypothetical protein